jgi:ech hydrogenase subunit B
MSHHGHQEIVKGITTELTGICLAMVEVTHWFETVFALGLVYIFFVWAAPLSNVLALVIVLLLFFAEIFIDNTFARFKWKLALKYSWIVTIVVGAVNLLILNFIS